MSWTDTKSIEHIKQIRDIFKVKTFVETGTFKGLNVLAHKDNFTHILSCEKEIEYYKIAKEKCKKHKNIKIYNIDSKFFLHGISNGSLFIPKEYLIYYLDAHFYDKTRPKGKGKFVVLDELKLLKGFKKSIIIIHDFDNGLGHITYDEISLDMKLLKKDLLKVNPNFKFYTNELSSCDIVKPNYDSIIDAGLPLDNDIMENLEYVWSCPEKTYRGMLYCLPKKVNIEGLKEI